MNDNKMVAKMAASCRFFYLLQDFFRITYIDKFHHQAFSQDQLWVLSYEL